MKIRHLDVPKKRRMRIPERSRAGLEKLNEGMLCYTRRPYGQTNRFYRSNSVQGVYTSAQLSAALFRVVQSGPSQSAHAQHESAVRSGRSPRLD
jgi:hypothetical protein